MLIWKRMWLLLFVCHYEIVLAYDVTVPQAGNCGDDTVLTCQATTSSTTWHWYGSNRTIVRQTGMVRPEDVDKYVATLSGKTLSLTIKSTTKNDEGIYKCGFGFDESNPAFLPFQCKASSATAVVQSNRKVQITIDKLYPNDPAITCLFRAESNAVTISGTRTCSSSTVYPGYYRCIWTSSSSLAQGSYTYTTMVTTITTSDPIMGSFRVSNPQTPAISNVTTDASNLEVLYGTEGQSLTLECISRGGIPAPDVTWYKERVDAAYSLATSNTAVLEADGTHTVTLQHNIIPTSGDDRKVLICRSYYSTADVQQQSSDTKSVRLYLNLKPSQPVVSQVAAVTSGNTVQIRCSSSNSRPAASIQWVYQGVTYNGTLTETLDPQKETYTVQSVFSRTVTELDNGVSVQCEVKHPSLTNPTKLTSSINISVQFPVRAMSTGITGNQMITATGSNPLTLTCTTGSSNPASNITWLNGTDILTSNRQYIQKPGENNGVVISQQLELYPTRYMDGNAITCSVANAVSLNPVTDTQVLDLQYSPLVTISSQVTCNEGQRASFTCTTQSKPTPTFTWFHNGRVILSINPGTNVHSYNITSVNRTHYGVFKCAADNTIGPPAEKTSTLNINFRPLSANITGNNNIVANGQNQLILKCISGTSNPVATIRWKVNGDIKQSNGAEPADFDAEYGGKTRERQLILTPTRYNDNDLVSCEAYNDLSGNIYATSDIRLDLQYSPAITPMLNKTVVEGNFTLLDCQASSKPVSKFTWYRGSQLLSSGMGSTNSNRHVYNLTSVRRTDSAIYRCDANNGIGSTSQNIALSVQYPPDVTVQGINTSVKANWTILTCLAKGEPDTGYKYGKWTQEWPEYGVVYDSSPGNGILNITYLTYQHSGIYSCSASNGIKVFNTEKEYMSGSIMLVVKSFPIITKPDVNLAEPDQIPGKLHNFATFNLEYYSNADSLHVTCSKVVNGSLQSSSLCTLYHQDTTVNLPVFSNIVQTAGMRTNITIQIKKEDDFGLYHVDITNSVGSATLPLMIVPQGPPNTPDDIQLADIQQISARVSWLPGFHGGFEQTFVVEFSTDNVTWNNQTHVFGGKNKTTMSTTVTGLVPSSTYFLRVYAFNSEGRSEYTDNYNFTTSRMEVPDIPGVSGAIIGGAVGGVAGLVIFGVVAVLLLKKLRLKSGTDTSELAVNRKRRQATEEDSSDEDVMVENKMYESAGQILAKDDPVYNKPVKKAKVDTKFTDVYAVVDKSKTKENQKMKKEKPKKKKQFAQGDIYENSPAKSAAGNNTYGNAAFDDNPYENPEGLKPSNTPKRNVNQDGLIYADLAFNDQPKGQKKLVIHGLDEMTTYVQVDFNKKADPLPDSDTEEQSTNKK